MKNSASPKCLPTPRLLRESMFRILRQRTRAGRVLDLCCGCGMIGLEAISRGAMLVTFVERSPKAASYLRSNIAEHKISDGRAQIAEIEAAAYLNAAARRKRRWDIVFVGATKSSEAEELITLLGRARVVEPRAVVIFEHTSAAPLPPTVGLLDQWRTVERDGTTLSFYNRRS